MHWTGDGVQWGGMADPGVEWLAGMLALRYAQGALLPS